MKGFCHPNILNILFIVVDKRLHQPMYLLICNLAVVDILYASSSSPTMIGVLVAGVNTISYVPCLVQMFAVHLGGMMEMFALSAMAFDRLIAISYPFQLGVVLTLEASHGLMIGTILGPTLLNPVVYCLRTKEIKSKLFNIFKQVEVSK
ncbi:olfactory receptor 4D2-like [Cebidichthys violaceus]|uniref:olfactory receptor 4D2-like n=1 Tax=Cebidichthys violaceus TaxID=271503 RepID=UPI0035CBCD6F